MLVKEMILQGVNGDLNEVSWWQNLFLPYTNNKGADQPTQPCLLINTMATQPPTDLLFMLHMSHQNVASDQGLQCLH